MSIGFFILVVLASLFIGATVVIGTKQLFAGVLSGIGVAVALLTVSFMMSEIYSVLILLVHSATQPSISI